MEEAEKSAYFWLTRITETIDEQSPTPYKPFPEKKYIETIIQLLLQPGIKTSPKSRSVMMTWTMAGAAAHLCQTRPATTCIVQSRDETRALKIIEYARVLYSRSRPAWQTKHPVARPLKSQPEAEIAWANNSWMKAITGTANSIRSEHPTIVIFDEAAFMEEFEECFNAAMGAKPLYVWACSSAEKGPFFDMIENAAPADWPGLESPETPANQPFGIDSFLNANVRRPCPGLTYGKTDRGWDVIHLHYSADPERNADWVKKHKATYSSEANWQKEQEINAYAKDGALVYPEFSAIHLIDPSKIPDRGCCFMAIDPHPRTPHAMLWVMIDKWSDWYVYREMWPSVVYGMPRSLKDTDEERRFKIRDYAETIAAMEGNSLDFFRQETDAEYAKYKRGRGEHIILRFMDQAGKAFGKSDNELGMSESYWERYQRYGIDCDAPVKQHASGEEAVRELLRPRYHEFRGTWPRLHISTACPEIILEFRRYRYKMLRRISPDRELPQEGIEARCHLLDLIRYLATAPIQYSDSQASARWKSGLT